MKTMKLLPLKIAVTSAMIVGLLGAASTANAQAQAGSPIERIQNDIQDRIGKFMVENDYDQLKEGKLDQEKFQKYMNFSQIGNTLTMGELNRNIGTNAQKLENAAKLYGELSGTVGTNIKSIKENKESIAKNKANIKTLAQAQLESVTFLGEQIQENKDDISTLTRKSFQNQVDIVRNNASIEDLYAYGEEVAKSIGEIHTHNEEQNKTLENLITNSTNNTDNIAKNKADADAKFKGVQTDIANNKITLAQHAKKIDDNQQAIEAKLGGKADLQKLSELKTSVDKNQAGIQLHDQKINNLGILHTMVARAVGNNTQGVATNKADIAKNNESIEDLYEANAENVERLTQVDNNVFVNRLNIQELKRKQENDIKDVVGMQNAIAEQADKNKNHIQDLAKAQLAGVEVMDELNKNVEKNKADADANFETLTKNQNTLIEKDKEHDKLITANKTAIDANKASADAKFAATTDALTKHGQDITKNAKSITDLGTKVDGFDGRVTALDTKVNGFDGRISALDTKVNTFDGRISALDTKVNAFDGRITALDSKVENGMASQAALSGLFQPYSVGKFNATAALGGYGSKSAVAIGAGYRVNPNLAFKAGAAINTSGDKKGSYNIGVNYEF